MNPRGKIVALSTAAVGIVVLVAAGVAWRESYWAREQSYLNQLQTGTEPEKLEAVNQLGEMRSARAVPILLQELRKAARAFDAGRKGSRTLSGDPRNQVGRWGQPISKALIKIGSPALPELLLAAVDGGDFSVADIVEIVLSKIEPWLDAQMTKKICEPTDGFQVWDTESFLQERCRLLVQDTGRPLEVRRAATEALAKLQSH